MAFSWRSWILSIPVVSDRDESWRPANGTPFLISAREGTCYVAVHSARSRDRGRTESEPAARRPGICHAVRPGCSLRHEGQLCETDESYRAQRHDFAPTSWAVENCCAATLKGRAQQRQRSSRISVRHCYGSSVCPVQGAQPVAGHSGQT